MNKCLFVLALLTCNGHGRRLQGAPTQHSHEDSSVQSAISSLATLLLEFNPSVAPSHFPGQQVGAQDVPKARLAARPRVGRISAEADLIAELLKPEILFGALAPVLPAVMAFNLQGELKDAKMSAEEAASAAKSDLDRMEEEKSALSKQMDEQEKKFESSIGNLKTEHSSEVDALQKQLSQSEAEKSTEAGLLSDKTMEMRRLQMLLTKAKEQKSALAEEMKTAISNVEEEKSVLAEEMKSAIDNLQVELDKKDAAIAPLEAKTQSLEDSISSLQTQLDKKTAEAQNGQTMLNALEKEKLALAKDVEAQLVAVKKTAAEKAKVIANLEKKTAEVQDLQTTIDSIEQEKLDLAQQIVVEKKAVAEKASAIAALEKEKGSLLKQQADLTEDNYEQEAIMQDLTSELKDVKVSKDGNLEDLEAIAQMSETIGQTMEK